MGWGMAPVPNQYWFFDTARGTSAGSTHLSVGELEAAGTDCQKEQTSHGWHRANNVPVMVCQLDGGFAQIILKLR